ncbi:MAG: hypothetical protein HC814_08400 [Rhodobacteraceae bacterium]|nr:hypothetical protein [Paracoccaceae bacterium]
MRSVFILSSCLLIQSIFAALSIREAIITEGMLGTMGAGFAVGVFAVCLLLLSSVISVESERMKKGGRE